MGRSVPTFALLLTSDMFVQLKLDSGKFDQGDKQGDDSDEEMNQRYKYKVSCA